MTKEYVLVTTISHFRLKYAIPLEAFEAQGFVEPIDTEKLGEYVSSGVVREFSQTHIGENVADVSIYNEADILTIFNADNAYLSAWSNEKKIDWIERWQEDLS